MKIDGLNNVTSGYQGQGSSVSTTQTTAAADTKAVTQEGKQPVITENGDSAREPAESGSKAVIREDGQASNEQIRQSIEKINKKMSNGEAIFGIHEATRIQRK